MTDNLRVLVADDNIALRSTVAEILSRVGYSVVEAEDGVEALEKLAAEEVDALVLDVKMPRKDGLSVLDDLEPLPPPPGVLLVSAYEIDTDVRARLGNRVYKILRKPVPPATLIQAVSEAIEVAKAARAT